MYVFVIIKGPFKIFTIPGEIGVVVCINLSVKEPHSQMVTLGSLGGVMVDILARNARDVGSILALDTISPISLAHATPISTQSSTDLQENTP